MAGNPFSLKFGREPLSVIDRSSQSSQIIDAFTGEEPDEQVYMITGVRGCGKTVLLNMIADYFEEQPDWIVVHLNPQDDMLSYWAASLASKKNLLTIFREARLNLSVFGMSIELDPSSAIKNPVVALEQMLSELTRKGKSVLITVDEASNTEYVRKLAAQFQIFMGRKFNIFLLMTGLYENIYELQREKNLTFLYRAPNLELSPLNMLLMKQAYSQIFQIPDSEAEQMAKEL